MPKIAPERLDRTWMQRQFAGFAEFRQPNGQYTVGYIYVITIECERLSYPHSSDRQQSDQGLIR
jgi:hypothetical protein